MLLLVPGSQVQDQLMETVPGLLFVNDNGLISTKEQIISIMIFSEPNLIKFNISSLKAPY